MAVELAHYISQAVAHIQNEPVDIDSVGCRAKLVTLVRQWLIYKMSRWRV